MINLREKIHHNIIFALFLISGLHIALANESQKPPRIQHYMTFKVNDMLCRAELNGLYLMDTLDLPESPLGPFPKSISMMQPIGDYLDESSNILSLRVANLSRYIDQPEKGYCEVIITAMVKNPQTGETESKEVSNLRITYIKNEEEDSYYPHNLSARQTDLSIDGKLASHEIKIEETTSIPDANQDPIERKIFAREFFINHSQPFSWVHKSTPITDTLENRQLLCAKYNELKNIIESRDRDAFRQFVEPGLTDSANAQGDDIDVHFDAIFEQLVEPFFNIDKNYWAFYPTSMDNYELEIMAGGKMFKFNEIDRSQSSPLQWYNPLTRQYMRYNPIFTMIDGKIVMATF